MRSGCIPGEGCITGGTILAVFFSVIMGSIALGQLAPPLASFIAAKAAIAPMIEIIERKPLIDGFSEEGYNHLRYHYRHYYHHHYHYGQYYYYHMIIILKKLISSLSLSSSLLLLSLLLLLLSLLLLPSPSSSAFTHMRTVSAFSVQHFVADEYAQLTDNVSKIRQDKV
jgi:4-hydroxybenzoate polyprenyltransferase